MKTLGERIKERRKDLGLSQAELAEELGYTDRSTIAKIEKGINDIAQSRITAFAEALRTTPAYLMGWTDDWYDYDTDEDNRFSDIPIAQFNVLQDHFHGDLPAVWHAWLNMQDEIARDAVLQTSPTRPRDLISTQDTHNTLLNASTIRRQEGAPALSPGALRVAMAYDELSQWGQKQVRTVADNELERMSDGLRSLQDLDPPPGRVIYVCGDPAQTNTWWEAYTLQENDPPQAEFGMTPPGYNLGSDFPAQNVVFINHGPMADGDIGVFRYKDKTVIRQWHRDDMGVYLLTIDRKHADEDIRISYKGNDLSEKCKNCDQRKDCPCRKRNDRLVWLGRVITRKRYEVPPHQLISDDENRPGKEPER